MDVIPDQIKMIFIILMVVIFVLWLFVMAVTKISYAGCMSKTVGDIIKFSNTLERTKTGGFATITLKDCIEELIFSNVLYGKDGVAKGKNIECPQGVEYSYIAVYKKDLGLFKKVTHPLDAISKSTYCKGLKDIEFHFKPKNRWVLKGPDTGSSIIYCIQYSFDTRSERKKVVNMIGYTEVSTEDECGASS